MIEPVLLGVFSNFCYDLIKKGIPNKRDMIRQSNYSKELKLTDTDVDYIVEQIEKRDVTSNDILNILSSLKTVNGDIKIINQVNSEVDNHIGNVSF